MPDKPLAYFITFHTYGTWLHGDAPGSVDREHNQVDSPRLEPDVRRRAHSRHRMMQEPYDLDEARRAIVCEPIVEESRFRKWNLLALHVRSNHVHLVVAANQDPEFVMRSCKAHASKCLTKAGFENSARKRWTVHGSTRYLWDDSGVIAAIEYTLHRQGDPMAVHVGSPSEPERQRGGS